MYLYMYVLCMHLFCSFGVHNVSKKHLFIHICMFIIVYYIRGYVLLCVTCYIGVLKAF